MARTAVAGGCLAAPSLVAANPTNKLPITGNEDRRLTPLDELMRSFLSEQQVPGGSLAVARQGKLVYARGFGYADVEQQSPVAPDALFRIASVSKPLTAVAVLQLAERGKLNLDSPVLDQIVSPPERSEAQHLDPRWRKVTIRHCLQHTGGWDRQTSHDPIAQPRRIMKNGAPTSPEIIGYMLRRPLDFEPGERFAYSNFGYLLLGSAIERASLQKYEAYVRGHVLKPLGISRARLGRPLLAGRAEGEVRYYDSKARTAPSLYPPDRGKLVPLPYGAENFAAFQAHGGWIASAVDLVRFAAAFDDADNSPLLSADSIEQLWACPRGAAGHNEDGTPRAAFYGCGWMVRPVSDRGKANTWHTGWIAGSEALLVRRHDGFTWAVLFNTAQDAGASLASQIDPKLHAAVDAVQVWPPHCQFDRFLE